MEINYYYYPVWCGEFMRNDSLVDVAFHAIVYQANSFYMRRRMQYWRDLF